MFPTREIFSQLKRTLQRSCVFTIDLRNLTLRSRAINEPRWWCIHARNKWPTQPSYLTFLLSYLLYNVLYLRIRFVTVFYILLPPKSSAGGHILPYCGFVLWKLLRTFANTAIFVVKMMKFYISFWEMKFYFPF